MFRRRDVLQLGGAARGDRGGDDLARQRRRVFHAPDEVHAF